MSSFRFIESLMNSFILNLGSENRFDGSNRDNFLISGLFNQFIKNLFNSIYLIPSYILLIFQITKSHNWSLKEQFDLFFEYFFKPLTLKYLKSSPYYNKLKIFKKIF